MPFARIMIVLLLAAGSKGTHEVRLGVDWVPLARGPATVSVVSFAPAPSRSPGVTVYGFKLAPDAACRGETRDPLPQPDARGRWGPFSVPKDRTLCVTTSAASGGTLAYSVR